MGILWTPGNDLVANAQITNFKQMIETRHGLEIGDTAALHDFSVRNPALFWSDLMDFCGIICTRGERVIDPADDMWKTRFFADTTLNYAENLLSCRGQGKAIIFRVEDGESKCVSWDELYILTAKLCDFFKGVGLKKGDRVAAMMPNAPQTVLSMLATTARGAVWSSCSPDFGEEAVVSRVGQIEPRFFIVCDGYYYKGRSIDIVDKVAAIVEKLPTLERVLVVSYLGEGERLAAQIGKKAILLEEALNIGTSDEVDFVPVNFNDPLYILYSSGTTGVPKCIVHGAGGVLLQHAKEHQLHCDLRPGDRLFYFTTCGWMMWNWMVSALASGVTLLLYEGSPLHPSGETIFDYLRDERAQCLGTSAKFIDVMRKSGLRPIETHDLSNLSSILSTGSPLAPSSFDYVYEGIKKDLRLSSMSGGADLCGCFVTGDPTLPVHRGEIQGCALGMDVHIYDADGKSLTSGKGELVCASPFPSMPLAFWQDSDESKYRATYFERYPGIWDQGDFAARTENGGFVIYGRSDATLNPSGVRIGTAELYNQVEEMPEIQEAVAIGQEWEGDTRVILFVRLSEGYQWSPQIEAAIRERIRVHLSPRHVPSKVIAVTDIPRTKSGKISEIAVRDAVRGHPPTHTDSLENPEALELYRDLPQLQS